MLVPMALFVQIIMSDCISNAQALSHEKGYPILPVPITDEVTQKCTSESKLLSFLLGHFDKLKEKCAAAGLNSEELALLTAYEQSTTPVIVLVHSACRSAEPFIVGIHARKSKGKEDLLQFRLPKGQQMTPMQTVEFNTWDEKKRAAYFKRLTEDDLCINRKFSNRHRSGNKVHTFTLNHQN